MHLKRTIILGIALCSLVNSVEINNNGYSSILVSISEDVEQPTDGGSAMIQSIQSLLTATSKALFTATRNRAYFADVSIVLPSTWKNPVAGAVVSNRASSNTATFKVISKGSTGTGNLPFTVHSGNCGVPGQRIELPRTYLEQTTDTETVKAKAMVHEWAKYRYGVFEEHGFPSDSILPYFYLHPDGYHAVTTCNSTFLDGQLLNIQDNSYCSTEEGLILQPDLCRFQPYLQNQDSTTSLMAFHFVDSVVSFCDDTNHDQLAPSRQNSLCGGKSVWSVISQSKDFANNNNPPAAPNTNTSPNFKIIQLPAKQPVLYVVVDASYPTASGTSLATVRNSLRNLVSAMNDTSSIGFARFKGHDLGPGAYLTELLAPVVIKDNVNLINTTIESIRTDTTVYTRDTAAAVRDSALKLDSYGFQHTGGSILYLVTFTRSAFNTSVLELDMVERYLSNSIKLVAVETGNPDSGISLSRFASQIDGVHHYALQFSNDLFSSVNTELVQLLKAPVTLQRTTISRTTVPVNSDSPYDGSFILADTFAVDTVVSLASPKDVTATVTLLSPNGETLAFPSQDNNTNWNILGSTPLVTSLNIPQAVKGTWKYTLTALCQGTCPQDVLSLQVISGISAQVVPQINVWTSQGDAGSIDASVMPVIIYVEVLTNAGRVGGLSVRVRLRNRDSRSEYTLPLLDTGKLEWDHSRDGVYSAVFHPPAKGTYDISVYLLSGSTREAGRLLPDLNQEVICCGTESTTTTISSYQAVISSAVTITVTNPSPATVQPSKITDLILTGEVVIGSKVHVVLTWTAPFETYIEPNQPVSKYQIKYSDTQSGLLNNFDAAKDATVVEGSAEPTTPGSRQEVTVEAPYAGKSVYFAIKSIGSSGLASDTSPIRWSQASPAVITTTSTIPDVTTVITSTTGRTPDATSPQTDRPTSPATSSSTLESSVSITTGHSTGPTTEHTSTVDSTVSTTTGYSTGPTTDHTSTVDSTVSTSAATTSPTAASSSTVSSSTPGVMSTSPTESSTLVSSTSPSSTVESSTSKTTTTEITSSTYQSSSTISITTEGSSTSITSPSTTSSSSSTITTSSHGSSTITSPLTSSTTEMASTTVSDTQTSTGTVTPTDSATSTVASSTSSVSDGTSTTRMSSTTDVTANPSPPTTVRPFYETPEFIGGVSAGATVLVVAIAVGIYCFCKRGRNKNEFSYETELQIQPAQKPRNVPPAVERQTPARQPTTVTAKTEEPLKTVTVVPVHGVEKEDEPKNRKQSADSEGYGYDNSTFEDDDGLIMTAL